jgi:hypothetical protein
LFSLLLRAGMTASLDLTDSLCRAWKFGSAGLRILRLSARDAFAAPTIASLSRCVIVPIYGQLTPCIAGAAENWWAYECISYQTHPEPRAKDCVFMVIGRDVASVIQNEANLLGLLRCIDSFDSGNSRIHSMDNRGNKSCLESGGHGHRKLLAALLQTRTSGGPY